MENVIRQFRSVGTVGSNGLDCGLKCEINNFVWMYAPKQITLDAADDLAMEIYDLFQTARKRVEAEAPQVATDY